MPLFLDAYNADDLYRKALDYVLAFGETVEPRQQTTRETRSASLVLHQPERNIITIPGRKLNYHYMVAEFLAILTGQNEVAMFAPYNENVYQFSDDGIYFYGAYGPKFVEQLQYVLAVLSNDYASRQAVINIWRERPGPSRDVPCTLSLQYMVRNGCLEAFTTMRSNDLWWGFPYDLYVFTQLQNYIASMLGLKAGRYHHNVNSLHIYQRHWHKALDVTREPSALFDCASTPLVGMPAAFMPMYQGITRLGPTYRSDMREWVGINAEEMIEPWTSFMQVLAHRFHKDDTQLPSPWRELIRGKVDG